MTGDVKTLRCVSAYHEPAWDFDVTFVPGEGYEMAKVQSTISSSVDRVYGTATATASYIDVKDFPTSYYNPCQKGKWNVVCVMYDQTGKANASALWVNHEKVCNLTSQLPVNSCRSF